MAQDPYGFDESAPATGRADDAPRAMWLALGAAFLGSIGICFCYLPYLAALPMGIYAAYLGSRALNHAKDEPTRTMANAALVSGMLSTGVNAMFSLFFLIYALMMIAYMGIFFVAMIGVAAEG